MIISFMRWLGFAAIFTLLSACATVDDGQVDPVVEPDCPYGYFDYSPFQCAPMGYYGPEWFIAGDFVGAGPWFKGHDDFHGRLDTHYDPVHGYTGALPQSGEHRKPGFQGHPNNMNHIFNGNAFSDGRGGRPKK